MAPVRIAYLCLQATRQGQASHAHVHEIISGLRRCGHEVELFEPAYASRSASPSIPRRLIEFRKVSLRFAASLSRFDIAYVRDHPLANAGVAAARRSATPVVLEVNGQYSELPMSYPSTRPLVDLMGERFAQRVAMSAAVITVTDGLVRWISEQTGHPKVIRIPNGANTELFTPYGPVLDGLPGSFALFYGALAAWQGIDTMLSAAMSPTWPRKLPLVIAGEGVRAEDVRRAAGEAESIRYLGGLPYERIPALVRGATLGISVQDVSASRAVTDVFPLKVFEMMACAKPVIVSDLPGVRELVGDAAAGLVVPAASPEALAGAVAEICADPSAAVEMGRRGHEEVVNHHSWDARARATAEVLEQVLAGSGPR